MFGESKEHFEGLLIPIMVIQYPANILYKSAKAAKGKTDILVNDINTESHKT